MNPRIVLVAAVAIACFATVRALTDGPEISCTRTSLAGLSETPGEALPMNVLDAAWACLEHLEKELTWRVLYNKQADAMFTVMAEGYWFEQYSEVRELHEEPAKLQEARERLHKLPVKEADFRKFCRHFQGRGAGGKYADWLESAAKTLNNPELVGALIESSLNLERIVMLRDFCKIVVQ